MHSQLGVHFLLYIRCILHYDIYDAAWNDDDFLWSSAVQLFSGQLVSHNNLLYFLAWSILCHLNRETNLTIELNRVLRVGAVPLSAAGG